MTLAPLLSADRARYTEPHGHCALLVGAANRFADDAGATRVAWGKAPPSPESVVHVHLEPSASQLGKGRLPEWLLSLPALRSLTAPAAYLGPASESGLLERLTTLTATYDREHVAAVDRAMLRWPEGAVSSLRALLRVGLVSQSQVPWSDVGLTAAQVPSLEYLRIELDKSGEALPAFAAATRLQHLEAHTVGDADVFSCAPEGLRFVHLNGVGLKAPFDSVRRLQALESLMIVGYRADADCATLASLPSLTELCVMNAKKLRNVDALVEMQGLRSLQVVNCGRPFSKELKARLQSRGLVHLNIDYA